ncbi:type II toxin-antitoxin system HicA family toxin [Candidatus Kaiserbacteria bacterium]|nr:type II toxin-antitoxin system HicA family toxin [Candidatus Kaiserbacteria bacterium]
MHWRARKRYEDNAKAKYADSHEIWFNPTLNRYITLPNHPGAMPEGTLRAILGLQAGTAEISALTNLPTYTN